MTKKQLQAKYDKMLKKFDDGHRELKQIKKDLVMLRIQIQQAPKEYDERPDELIMKEK